MTMNAYHRGRAQGMLLYPRPGFTRVLADLLLTALHIEYGKPEDAAQCASFFRGYAEGQRTMEDAVSKQAPAPAPVIIEPAETSYGDRMARMWADAAKRAEVYRIGFEQAAALVELDGTNASLEELAQIREGVADSLPPSIGTRQTAPAETAAP